LSDAVETFGSVEVLSTDDRGIDDQDEEVDCNNEQKAADAALVVPADIRSVAKVCEDHKPFPVKAFRKRFGAFFKNVKKALKKQPKRKGMKGIAWDEKPDVLPVVSFFFKFFNYCNPVLTSFKDPSPTNLQEQ
jgi:hypothetical protein